VPDGISYKSDKTGDKFSVCQKEGADMNKCILFCDDDKGVLEVSRIIFEEKGYKVVLCDSSEDILSKVKEVKPDVIFLDLMMPGPGGEEIFRTLKADKNTSRIPIIIILAHNDADQIAQEAGADDFISKPFDIEVLKLKAEKYLVANS
jgi:CheY-like chemotaxis protein